LASKERFTPQLHKVFQVARTEMKRYQLHINSKMLLLAMTRVRGAVAYQVLKDLNVEASAIRQSIEEDIKTLENKVSEGVSEDAKQVMEQAIKLTISKDFPLVGTEQVLIAMVHVEDNPALNLLLSLGVSQEQIRRQTNRVISAESDEVEENPRGERKKSDMLNNRDDDADADADDPSTARLLSREARRLKARDKDSLIQQLTTDLTLKAEEGKLDPVIGREKEIERIIQILARRTKNNPALIGEPGVGKTAVVEGLAQRIVDGDVPAILLDKRVYQMDMGSVVAGTMYRGQFEERLTKLIAEFKESEAIVFIDEMHLLIGTGSATSPMDAANILKPALSRGELQVIGATTLNEYRKYIENDAALERRFQKVLVEQPTVSETIAILHGLRDRYQDHHRLIISDEALEAAAKLSERYVSERFLPDKAIDLIDESASRVRLYQNNTFQNSKELMSQLRDIRNELKTLKKPEDKESIKALEKRQRKIKESLESLKTGWDRENAPVVNAEHVAEVISMWTGIPLTQLAEEESDQLLKMEATLAESIIGQEEAISAISKAVRRARAGLKNPRRPVGSFLFLGPTGVGKTELSKSLAKLLLGQEDALIQIDMSEFMEKHSVSRLIGSPPGYVGYDEAGQLTEAIRRQPYSVVVFDEIEKAHPDVMNLLLQIMEEGHLTDARGQKVDFKNAIIIMTTNVGAEMVKQQSGLGFTLEVDEVVQEAQAYDEMQKKLMEALKRQFRPEFINRLDSVIVFRALNREDIRKIVELEVDKVKAMLVEQKINLLVSDAALDLLAEEGYAPEFGARPVRRVVQQMIEEPLSDELLARAFKEGDRLMADIEEENGEKRIIFRKRPDNELQENGVELESSGA